MYFPPDQYPCLFCQIKMRGKARVMARIYLCDQPSHVCVPAMLSGDEGKGEDSIVRYCHDCCARQHGLEVDSHPVFPMVSC